ncbi:MAG: exodeoxyribonuclease VII large subunit [Burkholderiaceae bacterium]
MPAPQSSDSALTWSVSALCQAIAQALDARFNPVTVRGEITGFSRAASGHCYFSLKDAQGQIRCAMFRRAASLLRFSPRDGALVEVRGRVSVYEPRGDLQLVVESMEPAGLGALYEEFLRLKARLEAQGLFDEARKRPVPPMPRAIGLVTSPGAAALHDVVTALRRRAPHVPVILAPAAVQGSEAPRELVAALNSLYALADRVDVILLVRGGGSLSDLWAFNDEQLAQTIVRSPVPLICGVGHETDFTIADFCADLRAPTPTAAAELASRPRAECLAEADAFAQALTAAVSDRIELLGQRLDQAASRLGRPSARLAAQRERLVWLAQSLRHGGAGRMQQGGRGVDALAMRLGAGVERALRSQGERLVRAGVRLEMLDPRRVLDRGYAWLSDADGQPLMRAGAIASGQAVRATLTDGEVDLVAGERRLR